MAGGAEYYVTYRLIKRVTNFFGGGWMYVSQNAFNSASENIGKDMKNMGKEIKTTRVSNEEGLKTLTQSADKGFQTQQRDMRRLESRLASLEAESREIKELVQTMVYLLKNQNQGVALPPSSGGGRWGLGRFIGIG